jgi:predicted O-methyltransferase YrrM
VGFDATLRAIEHVEGWLTDAQALRLWSAASRLSAPARIVEIGSFQGRSTVILATAAASGIEVVAIDPHAGNDRGPREIDGFAEAAGADHAAFTANLATAGVAERVTHLRMFSDAALSEVQGEIDVLYIDGAHRYGPARADIRDWGSRLADGGTLLIHDSFSSIGVTLAIMRELLLGRRLRYVGRQRSLAIYRADLQRRSLANAARQLAQLPWFVKNVLLKVALTLGLGKLASRLGRGVPEWPY